MRDGAHCQQQRPVIITSHPLQPATTRTWTDNGNFIPDCDLLNVNANGECGRMDNQNFGKETFTKVFDPELLNGWGKRTYNWEMGVSVQQELVPGVGLTVGYVRRWFGNFYTADNTQTTAADYTPFSIPIPVDQRLPDGGGGTVSGLYATWCPAKSARRKSTTSSPPTSASRSNAGRASTLPSMHVCGTV